MKTVYALHPYVKDIDSLQKYMHMPIEVSKKLEWDSYTPEYVIATEHIYYNREYWDIFVRLTKTAKILIFYAGECISPDLNIFDYAICFDRRLICGDRVIRIPTRIFYEYHFLQRDNELVGKNCREITQELNRKEGFCNFIYSNSHGARQRKDLFDAISKYRKVDSLGDYLRNTNTPPVKGRNLTETVLKTIELKRNYKFSIACENACYSGYTSEKIWTSLQAHTVPIYWGDPTVKEEVNPDAFINAMEFEDFDCVVDTVRQIDEDDERWLYMVSQPWMTKAQEKEEEYSHERYISAISDIFSCNSDDALRRGYGFHPDKYREWIFKGR